MGQLRDTARLMAYLVQRIYLSGPAANLGFPDVADPDHRIEHALLAAGLIDITDTGGIRRWTRSDPPSARH